MVKRRKHTLDLEQRISTIGLDQFLKQNLGDRTGKPRHYEIIPQEYREAILLTPLEGKQCDFAILDGAHLLTSNPDTYERLAKRYLAQIIPEGTERVVSFSYDARHIEPIRGTPYYGRIHWLELTVRGTALIPVPRKV